MEDHINTGKRSLPNMIYSMVVVGWFVINSQAAGHLDRLVVVVVVVVVVVG